MSHPRLFRWFDLIHTVDFAFLSLFPYLLIVHSSSTTSFIILLCIMRFSYRTHLIYFSILFTNVLSLFFLLFPFQSPPTFFLPISFCSLFNFLYLFGWVMNFFSWAVGLEEYFIEKDFYLIYKVFKDHFWASFSCVK